MLTSFILAALLAGNGSASTPATTPQTAQTTIPAGTKVPLRLASMLSSHDAHTGQTFTFYVAQDVTVDGTVVIPRCSAGSGTITLAGRHGINGHEGNLRLRFDTVTDADGSTVNLATDEEAFNGTQRKTMAFFVSRWINGDDVEVKPDQILTATIAKHTPLGVARVPAAACTSPEPAATAAP